MFSWVSASGGHIPSGAKAVGHEANGGPALYAARASIPGGGVQLGKVRHGFGAAYIPYGGVEQVCQNYEVLVHATTYPSAYVPGGTDTFADWLNAPLVVVPDGHESDGFVPPWFPSGLNYANKSTSASNPGNIVCEFHAVVCGQENDGSPLFCALVAYEGAMVPGKVSLPFGGANISSGGSEISGLSHYAVLCDASYGFLTYGKNFQWPNNATYVPENSTPFGIDDDGAALYIARCLGDLPGLQLGKVKVDGFSYKGASFPYGGQEIFSTNYQVLTAPQGSAWVEGAGGSIPDGAVALGADDDGSPLFAARTGDGGGQIGKIRHGFQGAYISWGGGEQWVENYQVLCRPSLSATLSIG